MPFSPEHIVFSKPVADNEGDDFCLCLERIDLLFQQDYLQRQEDVSDDIVSFFLSGEEIVQHLRVPQGRPHWLEASHIHLPDADDVLTQRLQFLVEAFDLTDCERDVLLTALLPHLSEHYTVLPESGLGEGVNRDLLTRLFGRSQLEFQLLQSALHPASALFRFQLLSDVRPGGNRKSSLAYRLDMSVWDYLCGNDLPVTSLYPWAYQVEVCASTWYPDALGAQITRLCLDPSCDMPPIVVLEGHEQDGRERAVATLLSEYRRPLLCVDAEPLAELSATKPQTIAGIVRDVLLGNGLLLLKNTGEVSAKENGYLQTLAQLRRKVRLPVIVLADAGTTVPILAEQTCVHLVMPQPSVEEKAAFLQNAWPEPPNSETLQVLFNLTQRYAFTPSDIPQILQEADFYRRIRDSAAPVVPDDVRQALAHRTRKNFGKLAQRITPVRTFDDLVVSPILKKQLAEILAAIRHREGVTEKHFTHKTGGKIGISALFYGDSGTGKTLAAEVLARHLAVDLIKVDLSTVVNKYVGETEKNLGRIFDLAQADSGVLFFDEADALFGKRSETKDAHDRHANIEVSYLLQRLENYPGLVILATNNRNHLDSAFNRRFTFITRFTWPDAALRAQMWQAIWPKTLTLADDVNFTLLGASELTGANIRNVALLAAVLAAEDQSKKIHLHHIEHAINRELGKLGRLVL